MRSYTFDILEQLKKTLKLKSQKNDEYWGAVNNNVFA